MSSFLDTLYVCGPMTGLPEYNFPAFKRTTAALRAQGFTVVCPTELATIEDQLSWADCMRRDIKELMSCGGIVLLPGWQNSKGATAEVMLAHMLGMLFYRQHLDFELKPEGTYELDKPSVAFIKAAFMRLHFPLAM